MFKKIVIASLIVLALAVPLAGIALADQPDHARDGQDHKRPGNRYAGIVTEVNAAADEFSIENRVGEGFTFKVNPDTKFFSRNGELESFADLAVEMVVAVGAIGNDEGTLLAKVVVYIDPDMLDAMRARGEVIALGDRSFTILTRNQEELTLQVDENTRYKSRNGSLERFADLEVGMKVGVVFIETDEGTLLAKAVFSGIHRPCKPGGPDSDARPSDSRGPDGDRRPCGPGEGRPGGPDGAGRPNDLP